MKQKHRPAGLTELLRRVGEAPPVPFAPAPFQLAALDALEQGDVLVSAPTGSGKTWIAEQEIARLLRAHQGAEGTTGPVSGRVWYTAPLKALSNQKFRRFQRLYGETAVGLLTGERRVNADAPVLVATTEILRNVLYDANRFPTESGGATGDQRGAGAAPLEVIVLDEAHYLADRERGTAWEEILLLAPPEARLLLLSATIPNADELASWLEAVRGRRPNVVTLDTRPVPLQYLLADGAGRLLPPDPNAVTTRGRNLRWLRAAADAIEDRRLTPAILFFPSRRECDEAAKLLGHRTAPDEARRAERLEEWIAQVPHLAHHPMLTPLRRAGVAPHHAGHLTAWRMCVEELLEAGLIRFVCATTTLAAGLDVPARTVLLSTLHRHGPAGPEALTPTEFHQMTGRAGRRGRDLLGIAVIAVANASEADEGLALADAAPDPVGSAFTPSDAQVLNLLARTDMAAAEGLVRRSFAAFQRRGEIGAIQARLEALPHDPLTSRPCGDRVATRDRFERLLRELRQARRAGPASRRAAAPEPEESGDPAREAAAAAAGPSRVGELGRAVLEMPCTGCPVVEECLATIKSLRAVERKRRILSAELAGLQDQEVRIFRTRAAILRELGYLDRDWRLRPLGELAARIRHPRMLILAEAIRGRILPADAAALAAACAALGTERIGPPARRGLPGDGRGRHHWRRGGGRWHGGARAYQAARWQEGHGWRESSPADSVLASALNQASWQLARKALVALRGIVSRINKRLAAAGLPEDPVEREFDAVAGGAPAAFQRAAVVGAWAAGRSWEEVVARHRVPEGDLQRLIWQAAEILAQLEDLPAGPLPDAARAARQALLRTPVL